MKNKIYTFIKKLPFIRLISNRFCELQNENNNNNQHIFNIEKRIDQMNIHNALMIESLIKKGNLNEDVLQNGKIAVYTVIIGNYDELYTPRIIENQFFDYFCVTDNKTLKSDFWKIIYFDTDKFEELKDLDKTKISRYIKTHPHFIFPNYKHSLYIDGNVYFIKSIFNYINNFYQNKDILINIHPDRDCIYDEAKACILANKDSEINIQKQIEKYKKEKYPRHNGLVMANVIYRKHTESINNFDEAWWNEIKEYSKRDQISFNYIASKFDIDLSLFPYSAYDNKYYTCKEHKQ